MDRPIEALSQLGFTELESRIYLHLLTRKASTAYALAKEIGATNASTYKAIDSLHAKGAAVVSGTDTRLWSAVPFGELRTQLEGRFRRAVEGAERGIASLSAPSADLRIYELKTVDQVLAKAQQMLESAKTAMFVDVFPVPLERLRGSILEAALRGVSVLVQVYELIDLEACTVVLHPLADATYSRWPEQWVSMAADGGEYLIAAFGTDSVDVYQATWTASPFIAYPMFSYAVSQFQLSRLHARFAETGMDAGSDSFLRDMQALVDFDKLPGYRRLRELMTGPPPVHGS